MAAWCDDATVKHASRIGMIVQQARYPVLALMLHMSADCMLYFPFCVIYVNERVQLLFNDQDNMLAASFRVFLCI